MDYCSSCRRHLNGALVCPGCGAYAPDIAPMAPGGRTSQAPAAAEFWPEPEETPGADAPFDDPEGAIPLSEGRAARRRQKARWKKNQRRAVVATAVALVGGGLTVSAMNRGGSGQHTQASSTPADVTSMGVAETADQQTSVVPSAGTGKHRKPDTTSDSAANAGTSHRSSSATHTDSAHTRPYTASTPTTAASTSAHQTTTTSGTSTGTDTSASTSTSSTSTDTSTSNSTSTSASSGSSDSSGTSSSSGSTSSTSDSSSSTATTSPSGICLLGLVCVS
ncbi:SCO2400 family protein [Streptomyces sp. NPDC001617]